MSRKVLYGALLVVGGACCWFFPLFHIRPLGEGKSKAEQSTSTTEPAALAAELWNGPLRIGENATEVTQLWGAFTADPAAAQSQHGHQAGLGGTWCFCVRGHGTIESVENQYVLLRVAGGMRLVRLELGVIVDNTVRDALAVKASAFANSQDFNAISSTLNRRVEEEVIAPNRSRLVPGVVVDFVGCTKVASEKDLDPLSLVPIRIEVSDLGSVE
ncbi:DUF2291 family protein [Aeoliella sp.]|uniref:DUF2291 family protein n=1 Tax=Aeoliella sp. TaxID=2795800 RepID=UPI003CCC2719